MYFKFRQKVKLSSNYKSRKSKRIKSSIFYPIIGFDIVLSMTIYWIDYPSIAVNIYNFFP